MGNKKVNGKISIFDLKGERIYVGVTEKLVHEVGIQLKQKNINEKILGKRFYKRLKTYRRLSLISLKKVSRMLNISLDFIEDNISEITSHRSTKIGIKNPKLPFDFKNRNGMILIASIYGDGGISEEGNVRYHNQDKKLVDLFIKSLNVLGDVDYKIYFRKDRTFHISLPIIIGHILSALGIVWGYKTKNNPSIPNFLFNLNDDLKASFIRQFANDEGNVRLKDRRIQLKQTIALSERVSKEKIRHNIYQYSPFCLSDIRKLLLDLNIVSKISLSDYRYNGLLKTDWELSIYGKENIERFQKLIGFDVYSKKEKLDMSIKSYKCPSSGRNERLLFSLQYAAYVELINGFITKHLLSYFSKRALKTATYFLVDMKKKGLVKIIEKPRDSTGRLLPLKYKVTNGGWNYMKQQKERVFMKDIRELL